MKNNYSYIEKKVKGFTLVEVIVAITIFSAAIIPLFQVFTHYMKAMQKISEKNAIILAKKMVVNYMENVNIGEENALTGQYDFNDFFIEWESEESLTHVASDHSKNIISAAQNKASTSSNNQMQTQKIHQEALEKTDIPSNKYALYKIKIQAFKKEKKEWFDLILFKCPLSFEKNTNF